jgi:CheY-like chemotaxis protein
MGCTFASARAVEEVPMRPGIRTLEGSCRTADYVGVSAAHSTDGRATTAPWRKSTIVLLIDDDRTYLEMVTLKLELEGHPVSSATDGPAGIEIARREQPDIIFLDVVLPGIDGLELLARLKADPATRNIHVVIVSGRSERRLIDDCRRLGAVDFLVKSTSVPATLEGAVQSFARAHPGGG